jgi:hypothetical protein
LHFEWAELPRGSSPPGIFILIDHCMILLFKFRERHLPASPSRKVDHYESTPFNYALPRGFGATYPSSPRNSGATCLALGLSPKYGPPRHKTPLTFEALNSNIKTWLRQSEEAAVGSSASQLWAEIPNLIYSIAHFDNAGRLSSNACGSVSPTL